MIMCTCVPDLVTWTNWFSHFLKLWSRADILFSVRGIRYRLQIFVPCPSFLYVYRLLFFFLNVFSCSYQFISLVYSMQNNTYELCVKIRLRFRVIALFIILYVYYFFFTYYLWAHYLWHWNCPRQYIVLLIARKLI